MRYVLKSFLPLLRQQITAKGQVSKANGGKAGYYNFGFTPYPFWVDVIVEMGVVT